MNTIVCWSLMSLFGLTQIAKGHYQRTSVEAIDQVRNSKPRSYQLQNAPQYYKLLRFNVYRFSVVSADTGRVRDVVVKAYRGELLLTNFRICIDGLIAGAEVADLDNNRFPELYLYTTSDGSGSFGRVYGWQFLPERKADIIVSNWSVAPDEGYMGHDSLWTEQAVFCRKYPLYQPGDANAQPSGGYRMKRYHLRPTKNTFTLVPD